MSAERIFLLILILTIAFVVWEFKFWFVKTIQGRQAMRKGKLEWRYLRHLGISLALIGLFFLWKFYGHYLPSILDLIFFDCEKSSGSP